MTGLIILGLATYGILCTALGVALHHATHHCPEPPAAPPCAPPDKDDWNWRKSPLCGK